MALTSRGYRAGFIDALLGRDSKNPYGYSNPVSMANYNKGYFTGKQRSIKDGITLIISEPI